MDSRPRTFTLAAGVVLTSIVGLAATTPVSAALAGWARYIAIVEDRTARDAQGRDIDVPDALVHDWRGDVFITGATVDRIVTRLEQEAPPAPPNDVLSSRLLEHGPGWNRVALTLQRHKVITIVYATEHRVTFERLGAGRALSTSIATRIRKSKTTGRLNRKTQRKATTTDFCGDGMPTGASPRPRQASSPNVNRSVSAGMCQP